MCDFYTHTYQYLKIQNLGHPKLRAHPKLESTRAERVFNGWESILFLNLFNISISFCAVFYLILFIQVPWSDSLTKWVFLKSS